MCRKSELTTVVAVRLSVVERARLVELARAQGMTLSEIARRALLATSAAGVEVQHGRT